MRPTKNNKGRLTILVLILVMVAIEFLHSSVGTFCVVEGGSMYPTFSPNDVVQAKTLVTGSARGDVVIITDDRGDRVIKRIIGLPGERVTIYRGFVYINGKRLSEPYLPRHTYTFKCAIEDESPAKWCLGDNQFFVLGDNRIESRDSRAFGPVERHSMHSVVSLPENAPRPGFCGLILSKTGKVIPAGQNPDRNRTVSDHQNSGAKI